MRENKTCPTIRETHSDIDVRGEVEKKAQIQNHETYIATYKEEHHLGVSCHIHGSCAPVLGCRPEAPGWGRARPSMPSRAQALEAVSMHTGTKRERSYVSRREAENIWRQRKMGPLKKEERICYGNARLVS
ncbi:Protocadherin-like wing polarity protein stan [Frankliniella fusca]|uniref:Protocadherin-like wing polarity protein stan n=1 Tax=Frankliniella fusca TaxID=407009 RepID=A0AAE1LUT8_9NEOP|nr:Protocadherin-like wing polarity protein stan [Frankliniella fusca]